MGLLARLAGWLRPDPLPEAAADAIETLIDAVDPRLRLVPGYRQQLAPAMTHALAYIDALLARIPGPLECSREAWGSDPRVHALFGSADELELAFSLDRGLRVWFAVPPGSLADAAYVLLARRRCEREVFGVALEGGVMRRDVPQVTVGFEGFYLLEPAADAEAVRTGLRWRLLQGYAARALERIQAVQARHEALGLERSRLLAKRKALEVARRGLDFGEDSEARLAAVAASLADTERQQRELVAEQALERYLEQLAGILAGAGADGVQQLAAVSLRIDRLGVRQDAPDVEADTLEFADFTARDGAVWTVLLVRYPRAAMLAPERVQRQP